MNIIIGENGLTFSFQDEFPKRTLCSKCNGVARIGFVAHEFQTGTGEEFVTDLHQNQADGKLWLHDACAVAVYFCENCLNAEALWNQA